MVDWWLRRGVNALELRQPRFEAGTTLDETRCYCCRGSGVSLCIPLTAAFEVAGDDLDPADT